MDTNKIITHGEFLTKISEFYGITGTTLIDNVLIPEKDYIFDGQWPDTEFSSNKCLQNFPNDEFNTTNFWGRISEKYDEYIDSRPAGSMVIYNEVYDYTTVNPLRFDSELKNNQLLSSDSIDWEQHINIKNMVNKINVNITTFYDGGLPDDDYMIHLGNGKCYANNMKLLWKDITKRTSIVGYGYSDGDTASIKSSKLFLDKPNTILSNSQFAFSIPVRVANRLYSGTIYSKYSSAKFAIPLSFVSVIDSTNFTFPDPPSGYTNINTAYLSRENFIDERFDNSILDLTVALCRKGVDTMKHIDLSVFNNDTPYRYDTLGPTNPNRQCKFVMESDGTVNPYNVKISLCDAISETSGKVCTSRSVSTVCFRESRKRIPIVGQAAEYVSNRNFDAFDTSSINTYEAWSTGPYSTHHLNIFQDTIVSLNDGTVPMALYSYPKRLAFQNEQGLWIILGRAGSSSNDITLPELMNTTKQEIIPVNDGSVGRVELDLSIARQIVNNSGYDLRLYPFADESDLWYNINSGETLSCVISPYFSIKFTSYLPDASTFYQTTITLDDNISIGLLMFARSYDSLTSTYGGGIVDVYTYAQNNFNTNADGSVNYFPLRGGDTLTIHPLKGMGSPVNPV